ncbi:hypothetical protein GCM10007175_38090 [Pseudarthrobacter scleromae]|uniref:Secreted protein n=1 Tax=Pseudarthrobacter scleromae TaxID=158897 RepID=A0ABQ2CPI9_9MICC|nr:hypothetical protein GCM10007175_38090 [Pseudarthrobacter scleromae]
MIGPVVGPAVCPAGLSAAAAGPADCWCVKICFMVVPLLPAGSNVPCPQVYARPAGTSTPLPGESEDRPGQELAQADGVLAGEPVDIR